MEMQQHLIQVIRVTYVPATANHYIRMLKPPLLFFVKHDVIFLMIPSKVSFVKEFQILK